MKNRRTDSSEPLPLSWEQYQPIRRPLEVGFWVVGVVISAIGNSLTVGMDFERIGLGFEAWKPALWESSSAVAYLLLVLPMLAFTRRYPLHLDNWRRMISVHLIGSVAWSALHVGMMVAIRKLVYLSQGQVYQFEPWLREFGYEYLKDVRSYANVVLVIEGYRLLLRRWQGEASLLQQAEDAPVDESDAVERPQRFLVRKLGREFLVAVADVESVQAASNYVNLRVRGHEYPLRSTMAAIEQQLDPQLFVRIHRSYIVNLDHIESIEPLDTGDARVRLRDGSQLPCSRRYRSTLRGRSSTADAA